MWSQAKLHEPLGDSSTLHMTQLSLPFDITQNNEFQFYNIGTCFARVALSVEYLALKGFSM